jgi:hypothetical protein
MKTSKVSGVKTTLWTEDIPLRLTLCLTYVDPGFNFHQQRNKQQNQTNKKSPPKVLYSN